LSWSFSCCARFCEFSWSESPLRWIRSRDDTSSDKFEDKVADKSYFIWVLNLLNEQSLIPLRLFLTIQVKLWLISKNLFWRKAWLDCPKCLYGLPKIHKNGIPLRPILSAIKSRSYSLAKFLVSLLCPLATNQYTILLYIY
jgi:hypothetical protein